MSSTNRSGSATPWVLGIAFWPVFGFVGDLPNNVGGDESRVAVLGQWTSAIFHTGGALLAALVSPLWGLAWGMWAALVLARRLAASGPYPMPLRLSHLRYEVRRLPLALPILGVAVLTALGGAFIRLPALLGLVQGALSLAAPFVAFAYLLWGGLRYRTWAREQMLNRAALAAPVAAAFGFSSPTILDDAVITTRESDGAARIAPVPAPMALKLAPGNRPALEAAMALALPEFMLDPSSNHEAIVLMPVDDHTRTERAALAATGGLLMGATEATTSETGPDSDLVLEEHDLA